MFCHLIKKKIQKLIKKKIEKNVSEQQSKQSNNLQLFRSMYIFFILSEKIKKNPDKRNESSCHSHVRIKSSKSQPINISLIKKQKKKKLPADTNFKR